MMFRLGKAGIAGCDQGDSRNTGHQYGFPLHRTPLSNVHGKGSPHALRTTARRIVRSGARQQRDS
jgi:hypothetical protein